MTPDNHISELAEGLTKAQRAILLASSGRHFKSWWAILRHAKLGRSRKVMLPGVQRLLEFDNFDMRLSCFGLAVKSYLQEQGE